MPFHILITLQFQTSYDVWTSRTFGLPNDIWSYIWLLLLDVFSNFIHVSFVHTWLLDFHFFLFIIMTWLRHKFHIIMWWGHDKSLSFMTWSCSDWWHGHYLMVYMVSTHLFSLVCSFWSLMSAASKEYFILSSFWVHWSSRLQYVPCS